MAAVDGCFLGGSRATGHGEPLEVRSPWDGSVVGTVTTASDDDVRAAVADASAAWSTWRETPTAERRRSLLRLADVLDAAAGELAELQVRENGKLHKEMLGQAHQLGDHLRYYAGLLTMPSGYVVEPPIGGMRVHTERLPLGVVACLTPWNSPLNLLMWKVGPALAVGNTVVVKPSEVTPLSTLRFAELAVEAGLPPGVLDVVTGDASVGRALVEHPDIAKIAFTGSSAAGETVARAAATGLRPVSLELGGKSANIVFADADLEQAVRGVVAGVFGASGQTCMAGSRVLVQREVFDHVLTRLVAVADTMRLGDPFAPETDMGSIASPSQLARIETMVARAVADGATVAAGGHREVVDDLPDGLFFRPTVLTGVAPDTEIFQEEVFGPVVCVVPFDTEDDAVALANATRYGLAAGCWTRDLGRADRVASRLVAGTVWVNNYRKVAYNVPFGGMRSSGLGRENGPGCLEEFSEVKAVWVDRGLGVRDPFDPRA
ncbi:aldehyde dehydrogenase family protein [Cellulomonas sp. URHB0016]